ncbi:MAG: zinc ABC transporter substrate-binding protein, partial [Chloroflexi bacterium]|nr:zinc ABC transporter substrate-binding protein [Chloroflexota bacterium]
MGRLSAALVAFVLVAITLAACGGKPGPGEGKTEIVTTFYPLQFIASRVGSDRVDVRSLVKPGVEAHDFEPTATDLRAMSQADVFIYNGLGFEPWVDRALRSIERDDLIVVEAGLPGDERDADHAEDGHEDPHVWLDPILLIGQVAHIR